MKASKRRKKRGKLKTFRHETIVEDHTKFDGFLSTLEKRAAGVNKAAGLFLIVSGVAIGVWNEGGSKLISIPIIGAGAGLLGRPQLAKMIIDYFKHKGQG